ncbi:DUF1294 domain-containing protein [Paenibacillus albiflavus]|uniref:DUF1294 domain-containing protein n=1 Tax=Paenibacillus albiflavus TaxID=2545760 RepID=A0A4V2WMN5_9BACL|nr:DUF1294 domain-containing protein [Paenibacillus albiflavus]TCZ71065.1 DUF1294 domain-containing protein [Paenibacillus albiflavus]
MYNKGLTVLIAGLFLFITYALRETIEIPFLFIYLVVVNIIGFSIMLSDKNKAKRRVRRVPEQVLFRIAAIGGGIGSLIGMNSAHHKTKKWYFRFFIPFFIVVDYAWVLYWYLLK